MDIILSLLALIVLAIPMGFLAIAVAYHLGTPVIFKQKRPGLKGKDGISDAVNFCTWTSTVHSKRRYETYKTAFSDIDAISMNPYLTCSEPNFWLSCITINPEKSRVKPLEIMNELAKHNTEARPIWKPMHLQPVFADHDFVSVDGDVGGGIFQSGLCMPSDVKMTEEEQALIIETIEFIL